MRTHGTFNANVCQMKWFLPSSFMQYETCRSRKSFQHGESLNSNFELNRRDYVTGAEPVYRTGSWRSGQKMHFRQTLHDRISQKKQKQKWKKKSSAELRQTNDENKHFPFPLFRGGVFFLTSEIYAAYHVLPNVRFALADIFNHSKTSWNNKLLLFRYKTYAISFNFLVGNF